MSKQIQIFVQGPDGTISNSVVQVGAGRGGQPLVLRALSGVAYEIRDMDKGVAPDQVLVRRHGKNLELVLDADGQQASGSAPADVVIEGYYDLKEPSPLTGLSENGQYYSYVPQEGQTELLPWEMKDGASSYQGLGYDAVGSVVPWWPFLLGGLLLLGGAAAAGGGSSGGGSGSGGSGVVPIGGTIVGRPAAELAEDTGVNGDGITRNGNVQVSGIEPGADWFYSIDGGQNWTQGSGSSFVLMEGEYAAGDVQVKQTNAAGDESEVTSLSRIVIDNTAPGQPTIQLMTADEASAASGVPSGSGGKPEDEIITAQAYDITTAKSTVVVHGIEDDASWFYSKDGGKTWEKGDGNSFLLPDGEYAAGDVQVKQVDIAGNEGEIYKLGALVIDCIPPDAPEELNGIRIIKNNGDVKSGVEGTGEQGAVVIVKDAAGNIVGQGNVGDDGKFRVELDNPTEGGEELTIILRDAAGNESDPVTVIAADTTPPEKLEAKLLEDTGVSDADGITSNGTVKVSGLESGASWKYSVDGGRTWEAGSGDEFVLEEGSYSAAGNGFVLVKQIDAAGNESEPVNLGPVVVDDTPPLKARELEVSGDGKSISGKGDAGSSVSIRNENGDEVGGGSIESDGTFTIEFDDAQPGGQKLSVVLSDLAGNVSDAAEAVVPMPEAPEKPTDLEISAEGDKLTGKGDPGATIVIRDAAGDKLAIVENEAVVGSDGSFSITLNPALENGERLSVTQSITVLNETLTSQPEWVSAPDNTPPAEPEDLDVINLGYVVTGKGEPGAKVIVEYDDGSGLVEIGSGVVDEYGLFSVELSVPKDNGEELQVYLEDAAGNKSPAVPVTAPDISAPEAASDMESDRIVKPGDNVVSVVKGKGESGAKVIVKDAAGNTIGTGIVAEDGTFEVELSVPTKGNEVLSVFLEDGAKNISQPATVIAADTTAPAQASNVSGHRVVDGENIVSAVKGRGEAGAKVTIKDEAGVVIGTGMVAANGTFDVALTMATKGNEQLSVFLEDDAENISTPATVTAADTTAPDKATNLNGEREVRADDVISVIKGEGEPGSTVIINDAAGTQVGSGTVDADGKFSIDLEISTAGDEQLTVILQDAAGNTSESETVIAADTTPPDAPEDLSINEAGTILTGKGEPDSTVSVKDADGNEIGDAAVVGADGSFAVVLSPAQTSGQIMTVTLIDDDGNESQAASIDAYYSISASDSDSSLELNVVADVSNKALQAKTSTAVLTVNLSGSVTADVLKNAGAMEINVAENTLREIRFEGRGGGLLSIADYDLRVYKTNADGSASELMDFSIDNWFYAPILGTQTSTPVTYTFEQGQYFVFMTSGSNISLLESNRIRTTMDKEYSYAKPVSVSGETHGNVIEDSEDPSGIPAGSTITKVNDTEITVDPAGTFIQGLYGQLLIKADGSYTYIVSEAFKSNPAYGATESFTYTVTAPNGKGSDTATLEITLDFDMPSTLPSAAAGRPAMEYDGLDFDALGEQVVDEDSDDLPMLADLVDTDSSEIFYEEGDQHVASSSVDNQTLFYLADFQRDDEQANGGVQV